MNKEELLEYCYENKEKFLSDAYKIGEDGEELFECLILIVEDGTLTNKEQLSAYGMDY